MFGPKKTKISKADLKKSIVSANNKLASANNTLKKDIDIAKEKLISIQNDYDASKRALKDTKDMQVLANNELEAIQFDIAEAETTLKKSLDDCSGISEDINFLKESNKKLEDKSAKLIKSIEALEKKESELIKLTSSLKQIKKEESEGQETLELLAIELNDLENGIDSYVDRKSAAESEFKAFNDKISREKEIVLGELKNIKDRMATETLAAGKKMGKLDKAIADRISEIQEMEALLSKKDYEFTSVQSKISLAQEKIKDAEDQAEYIIKKAQEKAARIKSDFKDWKIQAVEEIAKLKIRGKIETIDKAGLKEVLDG
tara:strand:+ start:756 stop:1706 length:951 start_codon:yes stop_codon:yes gene_type:complete